eukprot:CAMPEP_0202799186 /NCGR_PEP_ID=MMETSP1388-20130828/97789_1 /ASSEMBLY_ACC=CAM_ASM_000864 /TAXON_ID=37098 /ORGANISM="Isochrysis sp, Strain CCMP1244" /LENGTH=39 /DNA_ID= /DNA_START= /DNA_END= /DNA_ORIENTATION=
MILLCGGPERPPLALSARGGAEAARNDEPYCVERQEALE